MANWHEKMLLFTFKKRYKIDSSIKEKQEDYWVSIDKKKREEREAKKQMVKNEAMSSVFGSSADIKTELIDKVEKNDSAYDKPRKKKIVTFGSGDDNNQSKKIVDLDIK